MTYLLLSVLTLILLALYAVISVRSSAHLYYVVPVVLAAGVGFYWYWDTVLGYPTAAVQAERFELLAYATDEQEIYMWVWQQDDAAPRAYQFPYTEQRHAELASAMQRKQNGQIMQGEFFNPAESEDSATVEVDDQSGLGGGKSAGGVEFKLYNIDSRRYLPAKQTEPN